MHACVHCRVLQFQLFIFAMKCKGNVFHTQPRRCVEYSPVNNILRLYFCVVVGEGKMSRFVVFLSPHNRVPTRWLAFSYRAVCRRGESSRSLERQRHAVRGWSKGVASKEALERRKTRLCCITGLRSWTNLWKRRLNSWPR